MLVGTRIFIQCLNDEIDLSIFDFKQKRYGDLVMKRIVLFYLLLLSSQLLVGQLIEDDPLVKDTAISPIEELSSIHVDSIVLDSLIKRAIERSPVVKAGTYNQAFFEAKKNEEKKAILSGVSLLGQYTYGNSGTFNVQQDNTSADEFNQITTTFSNRLVLGGSVQLSIGALLSRRDRIKQANYNVLVASEQLKREIGALKIKIASLYNEFILTKDLLVVYAKAKETAHFNYKMIRIQFEQGETGTTSLLRASDSFTKSSVDYERAKRDFKLVKGELELLTGVQLEGY